MLLRQVFFLKSIGPIIIKLHYPAIYHELKTKVTSHAKSQDNIHKEPSGELKRIQSIALHINQDWRG
jgi:hypothetical protein